jgi:hypothetical protein
VKSYLTIGILLLVCAFTSNAAPRIVVQELGILPEALSIQQSTTDDLNDNIAEIVSVTPWHPANTNPEDQEIAFTDGLGQVRVYTGLLNDFLGGIYPYQNENIPAAVARWYFDGPHNLAELRVFSSNTSGRDGRVFHHYDVAVTTDEDPIGGNYETPLIVEVTPVPGLNPGWGGFGLIGNPHDPGTYSCALSVVNDDAGGPLAVGATGIQISFYMVSETTGAFRDDWMPGNGDDRDGQEPAFESPLINEVDLFFGDGPITNPTEVIDWSLY